MSRLFGESILQVFRAGALDALNTINPDAPLEDRKQTWQTIISQAISQGKLVQRQYATNLIVTVGKQYVGDLMVGNEDVAFGYHAIGTGSTDPALSDTTLETEVNRKAYVLKERSGTVVTLSVFFTASESSYNIQECGVFGGTGASLTADSGKLFSHYLQSYDNSGGSFDLTFDYSVTIG